MKDVLIIDYGAGNLQSVENSLCKIANPNFRIRRTHDPKDLEDASHVVLPGVGAYHACKDGLLRIPGMMEALDRHVLTGRPFLGICVGMQLMVEFGLEHGIKTQGFGWIPGAAMQIEPKDPSLKIPHMGWNDIHFTHPHKVLEDIPPGTDFYFVHSYHVTGCPEAALIASCTYGTEITAIIGRDNIIGTQFHPEKSQKPGLRLLGNFLDWDGK